MIEMSEQIDQLAGALTKAQAAFTAVPKGKTAKVGTYSYKYADLADTWDVARKHLSDNGLSVVQAPAQMERGVCSVTTMLLHTSGQWMRSTLALDARDATPQSIGSVITYARRYGLAAMIGLVTDDDTDAQDHASDRREQRSTAQPSGTQQGRAGGAASYNGTTRGEGAPRSAGPNGASRPAGPTAADVRAAHAAASKTGQQIEALPEGLDEWDAKTLAEWHAYYTQFVPGAK